MQKKVCETVGVLRKEDMLHHWKEHCEYREPKSARSIAVILRAVGKMADSRLKKLRHNIILCNHPRSCHTQQRSVRIVEHVYEHTDEERKEQK